MARGLTGHSRRVFWLKIALPILALAILSTLFLFARRIDFEGALPYAEVNIAELANDPRLDRPDYATVTAGGDSIRVAAATARPGKTASDPMTADDVVAVYDLTSGAQITLQARTGALDGVAERLDLTGDVTFVTSDGYRLTAPRMSGQMGRVDISAEGGVSGTAPLGTITAETLRISGPDNDRQVVFNGGVRLIYKTQN